MRRIAKVAGLVGGLALLGGGYAMASIPNSGTGVYTACVKDSPDGNGHMLRMIDAQASETCSSGWTEKTWNQVGPAGTTGPKGDTGDTGPQGPAGPTSLALGTVSKADFTCAQQGVQLVPLPSDKRGIWASASNPDQSTHTQISINIPSYHLDGQGRIDGVYVNIGSGDCPNGAPPTASIQALMYDVS